MISRSDNNSLFGMREAQKKRRQRLEGGIERMGQAIEDLPQSLRRAGDVAKERVAAGAQRGLAAASPTRLGASSLGALTDVGRELGREQAQLETQTELDVNKAEQMAGQFGIEAAGLLEKMAPERKIEQLAMQRLLLEAQDFPQDQIDNYFAAVAGPESNDAIRRHLMQGGNRNNLLSRMFGGMVPGLGGARNPEDLG